MDNAQGTVLIVEDDSSIRRSLKTTLSALDFGIGEATTGEEALLRLRAAHYDAVLMDLNMPGIGGLEACRRVRTEFPHIPVVVVTVRNSEEDKVEALEAGADDYVTKPFQIRELIARIRSVIRRSRTPLPNVEEIIKIGIFELNRGRRSLKKRGAYIRLTPTEFDLIAFLISHAGQPIYHNKLLSSVWGPEYGDEREYLRTFVMQLRKKIEDDPSRPAYLKTVNYLGYLFSDDAQADPVKES